MVGSQRKTPSREGEGFSYGSSGSVKSEERWVPVGMWGTWKLVGLCQARAMVRAASLRAGKRLKWHTAALGDGAAAERGHGLVGGRGGDTVS